jgi:hypothetical protein
MLWYNYLYENPMFTNKPDTALMGKEKMLEKWEEEQGKSSAN